MYAGASHGLGGAPAQTQQAQGGAQPLGALWTRLMEQHSQEAAAGRQGQLPQQQQQLPQQRPSGAAPEADFWAMLQGRK